MSQVVLLLMRMLGYLPLPWLRALGVALGWLLHALVKRRRQVALTNLTLCFPRL